MTDPHTFDDLWSASVRYRHVSRELEHLLREVHEKIVSEDVAGLRASLETLLEFLSSANGRTDANCSVTYRFFTASENEWREFPADLRAILEDMSGTIQESIYAPVIAQTFESTPEQLLERVRAVRV